MKFALRHILLSILSLTAAIAKAYEPAVALSTKISNQGSYTSSYNSEFKLNDQGLTWTAKNFNNNNSAWDNIRCGSKSEASTATITTDFSISQPIVRVEVEIGRYKTGRMTSMSLLVSPNANMSDPTIYSFDISALPTTSGATATISVDLSDPLPKMYYQLSLEMPKVSSAGVFSVNTIKYYAPSPEDTPGVHLATLNFTDKDELLSAYAGDADIAPGGEYGETATNNLNGATFTVSGGIIVSLDKANGTIQPRWWESKTITPELRLNPDNTMTIALENDRWHLLEVKFLQGNSVESYFKALDTTTAETNLGPSSIVDQTWKAGNDENVKLLTLTFKDYCRCGAIQITYLNEDESLSEITLISEDDNDPTPAEYFNLQGMPIANPTPGLYIIRRGTHITKEIIK